MKKKIIEIIKENNRINNVKRDDLYKFAKKHLNEKISSRIKKTELKQMLEEYLTEDTLLEFTELKRFGLAKKDLPKVLNLSVKKINKLIEENQIEQIDAVKITHYKLDGYIYVYSIKDILKFENKEL